VVLSPQGFTYHESGMGAAVPITLSIGDIHGFGYQRRPGLPIGWEVTAITRSGLVIGIAVPTRRKEDARWIARRLNAALAEVQRVGR
jgi:hypothetical protein